MKNITKLASIALISALCTVNSQAQAAIIKSKSQPLAVSQPQAESPPPPPGPPPFKVYNAMFYDNMGVTFNQTYGTQKACVLYEWRVYGRSTDYIIPRGVMGAAAREFNTQNCAATFIDIERIYAGSAADGAYCPQGALECYYNSIRLRDYFNEFKANTNPQTPVGWYSITPVINQWIMYRGPQDSRYAQLQRQRDALSMVTSNLDIISPVYYYVEDPDSPRNNRENWRLWVGAVTNMTIEARRVEAQTRRPGIAARPIIAWISPVYEDRANNTYKYVSAQTWRDSLELLYSLGVHPIIWDGWDPEAGRAKSWPPLENNGQVAAWWPETVRFLQAKGIAPNTVTP